MLQDYIFILSLLYFTFTKEIIEFHTAMQMSSLRLYCAILISVEVLDVKIAKMQESR